MATAKETARRKVAAWLTNYESILASTDLADQPEATTRSWAEGLLEALGWDAKDPRQIIQEYRLDEFEAQRMDEGAFHHTRPDYALLAHGRPILYLETKRFSAVVGREAHIAFQVRSYGWCSAFKLSYAFDVERLAVYDCRLKPRDDDEAGVGLACPVLTRTEYLEKFDLLWDYLGREAIEGGSLERLHPDDRPPAGSLPLDQDFEAKLSTWRLELAKTILRTAETFDEKIRDPRVISAATQRILDRIIFLRFCEAFGLEDFGTLLGFATHEDGFWPPFMAEHESRYRKVYDGILFPIRREDDPTGIEHHLREWWLRGKIFREIVSDLYDRTPYRFDAIPIDLLGGIYERYLGKRLEIIGGSVKDGFKAEYQRTKGAVYTPAWVVQRVVQRTLDPLALGRDPEELLKLKILDPACGSGSFLLGVADYLEG